MADEEQLAILKLGVPEWNSWRQRHIGVKVDLSGAKLFATDLTGVDFANADLSGADRGKADLSKARLGGARLFLANLRSATLTGQMLVVPIS